MLELVLELWLCRHAEALGGNGLDDHARELSPAGVRAAEALAASLAAAGQRPQRVLTSTAVRARRTAEIAFGGLQPQPEILALDDLYLAAPTSIRQAIAKAGGTASVLAVVGHNPGLHKLARELAGEGDPGTLAQLRSLFPPCALAQIALLIDDWRHITGVCGRLVGFWLPGGSEQRR